MKEFKSGTGVDVVIQPADFKDAKELKDAIMQEIASAGLDIGGLKGVSLQTEMKDLNEGILNSIVKVICQIDSSPRVYNSLMKCMVRCTYDKEKITEATFESEGAREDYYTIIIEVVKENLRPFFKGLVSGLPSSFLNVLKSNQG